MSKIYKSLTDLIGNTPLLELSNYEKENNLEAKILVKLEYFNPAGSVKDRIAKKILDDAEAKGLINKDTTIIEPTSKLALFHIKNTQARLHWKKVKDVNKEMNRLMIGLGDYPEFWKLLSRREKKIVTTYRLSSLLGYWRLYYYNWKNKL